MQAARSSSSGTAFLADAMLGSVARKLRIFGFDTLYTAHIPDSEILKIGAELDRIVLTCDRELFKRVVKAGIRGVLLNGSGDYEDLLHIFSKCGIASVNFDAVKSRCSACNGSLIEKKPFEVKDRVPDNVAMQYKEFFECTKCSKVYWEGGHLKRIRALARKIDAGLKYKTPEEDKEKNEREMDKEKEREGEKKRGRKATMGKGALAA